MAGAQPSTLNLQSSARNLLALVACFGLVQIACYYLAGATVRGDGAMAIAQPDTLLYCQAARRIAEGAPFSYSAGTAVSTGTTSVIYPFILAVPYLLGCTGDSLLSAGFLLNAIFYLVFLLGWGALACHVFSSRPKERVVSMALLASFGPFAYCALAQSDIGLWMAVSAWLAYGLFVGSRRIYVPLLILAPWVRPEGMVVVLSFCCLCAFDALRRRKIGPDAIVSVVSVASVIGVFALNFALTGECQFSSVAHKGHFKNLSFFSAVYASAIDFMRIAKPYLLGMPQNPPRDFFFLPVIGAAFLWIGVLFRTWRNITWRELAWYLAIAGSFATVATSGWQNTNLDRYLVWTMPALLLHVAFGCGVVAERLKPGPARSLPAAALVGFSCAMAAVFVCLFRYSSARADASRAFAVRCESAMPEGSSIGAWGDAGVAYSLLGRRFAHLSGIYSPEFVASSSAAKVELLKNEPATRFDYWLCKVPDHLALFCGKPDVMAGEPVLMGPPDIELRKADWKAYDAALGTPPLNPQPSTLNPKLVARIDVAYERDEKACGYEALTRDDYPLFEPFVVAGKLNGTNIVEGGRFLLGGDSMSVALSPGKDVHVVMRTALKCTAATGRELGAVRSDFALKSPMRLKVLVDGLDVGDVEFPVEEGDFCDAHFVIPLASDTSAKSASRTADKPLDANPRPMTIRFLGEHVAFAYWFYQ